MPDANDIARIAAAMHAHRPDWRIDSLVTFLTAHHSGRPYRDLAIAATIVATDEKTHTPQLLNQHGPWWVAAQTGTRAATPTVGPGAEPRCLEPEHERELARACRLCRSEAIAHPDPKETP